LWIYISVKISAWMIFIPKDKKCILKKTFIISMSGNEKIKTASFVEAVQS
jgi:hypothetical protein